MAKLTKGKRKKKYKTNIVMTKWNITTELKDIKYIIRKYYEPDYANTFEDLEDSRKCRYSGSSIFIKNYVHIEKTHVKYYKLVWLASPLNCTNDKR